MQHRFLISFDKTSIHYIHWPAQGTKRASVLIVHGAGEYAERYEEIAHFLNDHQVDVYGMDLRGYGQSGGPRAYAKSFDHHGRDIQALIRLIRKTTKEPLFLYGTSMGGLITAYSAAFVFPGAVDALLLSSPCFGLTVQVPARTRWMATILSYLMPRHLFDKPEMSEILSHDPAVVAQHKEDPRIFRKMSARTFISLTRAMGMKERIARSLHVPVGVFQAGDDHVVDAEASRQFYEALKHQPKEFVWYDNFFHEIIHEIGKERVLKDMLAWLDQCIQAHANRKFS